MGKSQNAATNRVSGGYNTVYPIVKTLLESDVVPILWGPPGVGKSTMAQELAKKFNIPCVIQILSHQADPADLVGGKLPGKITVDGKEKPVLHDACPGWFIEYYEKNQPFLLFLDEVPNSPAHATTILNSIILERRIGQFKLPEGTKVLCAGNRMEDQCMVYPLSAALQQRMAHIELMADVQDFTLYAKKKGLEPQIAAYINWKGLSGLIVNEGSYPRICPRVWEMADNVLKIAGSTDRKNLVNILGSVVGLKAAIDFKTFLEVWGNIDLKKALAGEIPDFANMEESTKYAFTFAYATEINRIYKNKTQKAKFDWNIASKVILAKGYPTSLATVFFINLDESPIKEAANCSAFQSLIDRVVPLLTMKF